MGNSQQFNLPNAQQQASIQIGANNQKQILQSFGVTSRTCDSIRKILRDYEIGPNIFIELLQNSDDAKAETVKFFIVEKDFKIDFQNIENPIFSENINETMGPALYIYDDGEFSEKNQVDISLIAAESKKEDISKTGKFGVGFRSIHHLTDLPCWISKLGFSYQDPMEVFIDPAGKNSTGAQGNLQLMEQYKEHFAHLLDLGQYSYQSKEQKGMQYNPDGVNGKLFRFPLRTQKFITYFKQAQEKLPKHLQQKLLSEQLIDAQKLVNWSEIFFQDSGSDILLFLKWVMKIEFYYWGSKEKQPKLMYQIKFDENEIQNVDQFRIKRYKPHQDLANLFQNQKLPQHIISQSQTVLISTSDYSKEQAQIQKRKWIITQGVGGNQNLKMFDKNQQDYRPLAGIASCLNPQSTLNGRMYCMLPLPIQNQLPFHLNGFFILDSSRRNILIESQSKLANKDISWNSGLINDLLVQLTFDNLSQIIDQFQQEKNYQKIKQCLPSLQNSVLLRNFSHSLLSNIYEKKNIFPFYNMSSQQVEFEKGSNLLFLPLISLQLKQSQNIAVYDIEVDNQYSFTPEFVKSQFVNEQEYELLQNINLFLMKKFNQKLALFTPKSLVQTFFDLSLCSPILFQILSPINLIKSVSSIYREKNGAENILEIFQTPQSLIQIGNFCHQEFCEFFDRPTQYQQEQAKQFLNFPIFQNTKNKTFSLKECENLGKSIIIFQNQSLQNQASLLFPKSMDFFLHQTNIQNEQLQSQLVSTIKNRLENVQNNNNKFKFNNITLLDTNKLIDLCCTEYQQIISEYEKKRTSFQFDVLIDFQNLFNFIDIVSNSQQLKIQFFQNQNIQKLPMLPLQSLNKKSEIFVRLCDFNDLLMMNNKKGNKVQEIYSNEILKILHQIDEISPVYLYNQLDQNEIIVKYINQNSQLYEQECYQKNFINLLCQRKNDIFSIEDSEINILMYLSEEKYGFLRELKIDQAQYLRQKLIKLPLWLNSNGDYSQIDDIDKAVLINSTINPIYNSLIEQANLQFLSQLDDTNIQKLYKLLNLQVEEFNDFFCNRILHSYIEVCQNLNKNLQKNSLQLKQVEQMINIFNAIMKEIQKNKGKLFKFPYQKQQILNFSQSNCFYNPISQQFIPLKNIIFLDQRQQKSNRNSNENQNQIKKVSYMRVNAAHRRVVDAKEFQKQQIYKVDEEELIDINYILDSDPQYLILQNDSNLCDKDTIEELIELNIINVYDQKQNFISPPLFHNIIAEKIQQMAQQLQKQPATNAKTLQQQKLTKNAIGFLKLLNNQAKQLQFIKDSNEKQNIILNLQKIQHMTIFPNQNKQIAQQLDLLIPQQMLYQDNNTKILYQLSEINLISQNQNLQQFFVTYQSHPNCIVDQSLYQLFSQQTKKISSEQHLQQIKETIVIFNSFPSQYQENYQWLLQTHKYCWKVLDTRCREDKKLYNLIEKEITENEIIFVERNPNYNQSYQKKLFFSKSQVTTMNLQCEPVFYYAKIFDDYISLRSMLNQLNVQFIHQNIVNFCKYANSNYQKAPNSNYAIVNLFQKIGLEKSIRLLYDALLSYFKQKNNKYPIDLNQFYFPVINQDNIIILVQSKECFIIDNEYLLNQIDIKQIKTPHDIQTSVALTFGCRKLSESLDYYLLNTPEEDKSFNQQKIYWNDFIRKNSIIYAINRILLHTCMGNNNQFEELTDAEVDKFRTTKIKFVRSLNVRIRLKIGNQFLDITKSESQNQESKNVSDHIDLATNTIYLLNDINERDWIAQLITMSLVKILARIRKEIQNVKEQYFHTVLLSNGEFQQIKMRLDKYNLVDLKPDSKAVMINKEILEAIVNQEEVNNNQNDKDKQNVQNSNMQNTNIIQNQDKQQQQQQQQLLQEQQQKQQLQQEPENPNENPIKIGNNNQEVDHITQYKQSCENQIKVDSIINQRPSYQSAIQASVAKAVQEIQVAQQQQSITQITQITQISKKIDQQNIISLNKQTNEGLYIFYESQQYSAQNVLDKMDSINKLSKVLHLIAKQVFEFKTLQFLGIVLEKTNRIAFNLDGRIYFNANYWQYACNREGINNKKQQYTELGSFLYVVFCHELAHNIEHDHNSRHETIMESLIVDNMFKFQQLPNLSKIVKLQ